MEFSLLRLNNEMRELIHAVAPEEAEMVMLDPLDKGLSGASVWLAKWSMSGAYETPFAVVKIGDKHKIQREIQAYNNIVQDLDPDVGAFRWQVPKNGVKRLGIIKQPFRGNSDNLEVHSLLDHVRSGVSVKRGIELIDEIYLDRMKNWHPVSKSGRSIQNQTVREALDWWMSRFDLVNSIESMCRKGMSLEIRRRFKIGVAELEKKVQSIADKEMDVVVGPVHGDLHAQNIILEPSENRIHLIDFGWTARKWKAIDFLMLECSLKFLATPSNARATDLLGIEENLEEGINWMTKHPFGDCVFGTQLNLIGGMIARIRNLCINEFQYVSSFEEYRRGLVALTGALASLEPLNRRFLVNSLAFHCARSAV